jgi:outer membrane protein assembly factor BamA
MLRLRSIRTALILTAAAASSLSGQRLAGVELSGIPALNFDADEGFGYGAVLALYKYEPGSTAYRWTVQPTLFMTTRGRRDYTLFFDSPSTDTRPWRVTGYAGREQQLAAPYYGIGNETPFDAALETGPTRYYYRYGLDRLRASADIQHTLGRPALRYLVGAGASRETIDLTPFDSGSTLIQNDMNGRQPGSSRTNYVRAGLTWDTRDREIGTTTGTWADVLVQRVDSKLGASWNYTRWTAAARHYQPLGQRVTLANRLVLQNTIGDAPFYSLSELPTTQKSQDGLGGTSSIRGIPKDRYVGKGVLVSNNEVRWRAAEFGLLGRPSSLVVSGFLDAGRVWSNGVDLGSAFSELHAGYGGGARLGLGPSFVIATDVGHSAQSAAAVYIGLGYLF